MSKSEAVKVIFCVVVSALLSIFPSLVPLLSLCLPVIYNQEQKEIKKNQCNKKTAVIKSQPANNQLFWILFIQKWTESNEQNKLQFCLATHKVKFCNPTPNFLSKHWPQILTIAQIPFFFFFRYLSVLTYNNLVGLHNKSTPHWFICLYQSFFYLFIGMSILSLKSLKTLKI